MVKVMVDHNQNSNRF